MGCSRAPGVDALIARRNPRRPVPGAPADCAREVHQEPGRVLVVATADAALLGRIELATAADLARPRYDGDW